MEYSIKINNICVAFGDKKVVTNFSLCVGCGEFVLIKGVSGCGKSTILHTICGLIPSITNASVSGDILIFGEDIKNISQLMRAKLLGIVFQNPETGLFCDCVEDEIAFGLENLCVPREIIKLKIDEMLHLTNLEKYRYASPKELSGGEKQRLVLAAVLALDPQVLLLDEALSQLDKKERENLIQQFAFLKNSGKTIIAVDHEDDLNFLADKLIDME